MTSRTRGRTIRQIVQERRQLMLGWRAFFGVAEVRSPLRDLDKWIRRGLRSGHGDGPSGTGSCKRVAWAGCGPAKRSSQPMARGV